MKKGYISYFQSVMTVGILTESENELEAGDQAKKKLADKNEVNHCYFGQTDFQLSGIEEWKPEFEKISDETKDGLKFVFDPSDEVKGVIAARQQKSIDDLTNEDIAGFVKESVENQLVN